MPPGYGRPNNSGSCGKYTPHASANLASLHAKAICGELAQSQHRIPAFPTMLPR